MMPSAGSPSQDVSACASHFDKHVGMARNWKADPRSASFEYTVDSGDSSSVIKVSMDMGEEADDQNVSGTITSMDGSTVTISPSGK
jgi:hypothetical protein